LFSHGCSGIAPIASNATFLARRTWRRRNSSSVRRSGRGSKSYRDLDNTSRNGLANVLVMETDLAQLAHDRFEIADALHRYAFGLDHGDADSLASAVTEDCRFGFRPAARKLEIAFPLRSGRAAIRYGVRPLLGPR